ncbi:peptidoglycan DD-metalloendopeptidase family protein [Desulfoluna sp.]|uniref:peptidoglycan DD-metalloendopeptidase family protein n=1 Tax=Desulfoluna sp. TaxID=2045199 RepID=UPI00262DCBC1|nr:peptidoglycan DD-metalloendopeptidase family protein [Desulfoluna sp.]
MFFVSARVYERSLLLILVCVLLGGPVAAAGRPDHAVVVAEALNVRRQPSASAEVLWGLSRGDVAEVIRHSGGWALIRFKKRNGYIAVSEQLAVLYVAKERQTIKTSAKKTAPVVEKTAQTTLVDIRHAVQVEEASLTAVRKEERSVIRELDRFNKSLALARKKERGLSRKLATVEKKVAGALADKAKVAADIRIGRRRLMARLVAYHKLNQIGEMNTFASSGSFHDMVVKKKALTTILGRDADLLAHYAALLKKKDAAESRLAAERSALAAAMAAHGAVLADVEAKYQHRAKMLKAVREKKVLSLAAIAEMKQAERALAAKVEALIKARKALASKNRFVRYKGLLKYPVTGKIVNTFGRHKDSRMNLTTFENGINIRTQRGEPVHAVTSGDVLFADWLKGYGNLIIVNHGENWYTLYAHADEMFKEKGDRVDAREVIATVGDSSLSGHPDLHFEIRHHGKPLNPSPWFKK